jgi:hypothetical protein
VFLAAFITVLGSACSSDPKAEARVDVEVQSVTSTNPAYTTTSSAAPQKASAPLPDAELIPAEVVVRGEADGAGDFEGQVWDIGLLTAVSPRSGTIRFDRLELRERNGELRSGATLTAQPHLTSGTLVNSNATLRTFMLAPDLEVQALDPATPCAQMSSATAVDQWIASDQTAMANAITAGTTVGILRFDQNGHVTGLWFAPNC